ncbi:MAG: hypothetical protein IJC44_04855, partial [Clostridia bacterium]|nr:hypothetical protein [Clostridia bacterium]
TVDRQTKYLLCNLFPQNRKIYRFISSTKSALRTVTSTHAGRKPHFMALRTGGIVLKNTHRPKSMGI